MPPVTTARAARAALPGVALAIGLGLTSMLVADRLSRHVVVPEVFVALMLGALVVNTPLAAMLGLGGPRGRTEGTQRASGAKGGPDVYSPGLTFVSKTLLRVSVVFMGLRIQTLAFGTSEIVAILLSLAVAIPCTFLLTHALAYPLGISKRLADMIAAGTMICGASAVNAVAPVVGAKKEDQGIALGTVFLFSAVAMIAFRPIAQAFGLSAAHGGLWSGLAVNDLASAVAVGAQMGAGGAEMAAASKSARIVMLAPVLVGFAFVRGTAGAKQRESKQSAAQHFPPFVAGFVILAVLRMLVDMVAAQAPWWKLTLEIDRTFVALAMAMVSASIGLHLKLSALLAAGVRAVALGAVAASTMAGLNLVLLLLAARGAYRPLFAAGGVAMTTAFVLYRISRLAEAAERRRLRAEGAVPRRRLRTLTGSVQLAPATGEFPASRS